MEIINEIKSDKKLVRQEVLKRSRNFSNNELGLFSKDIFNRLEETEQFKNSKCILSYYSFEGEVNTHEFIDKSSVNKTILLPVVNGDEMVLREYKSKNYLKKSSFGVLEPDGEDFLDYDKIDLVVVPGVAFDLNLNRLGRGKGYYDKLLRQLDAFFIGVGFSFQIVEKVPVEEHDIQMNLIISQDGIIA